MVEWSIEALRAAGSVRSIVVACPPGCADRLEGRDIAVVEGGATRSASVSNALQAVDTELVAIHDAARPLLTSELVEGVVAALAADRTADGAIAAAPLSDTIKLAAPRATTADADRTIGSSAVVERTLDRGRLWAAQTPQVFRVEPLREALAAWSGRATADRERVTEATDEAMLVEAAGGTVLIHAAPPGNLKVTTPLDLRLAELLLSERSAQ
jgi:2-C-methyl-D-erythritol 4-phosphate cytidylyltransferase